MAIAINIAMHAPKKLDKAFPPDHGDAASRGLHELEDPDDRPIYAYEQRAEPAASVGYAPGEDDWAEDARQAWAP